MPETIPSQQVSNAWSLKGTQRTRCHRHVKCPRRAGRGRDPGTGHHCFGLEYLHHLAACSCRTEGAPRLPSHPRRDGSGGSYGPSQLTRARTQGTQEGAWGHEAPGGLTDVSPGLSSGAPTCFPADGSESLGLQGTRGSAWAVRSSHDSVTGSQ